MNPSKVVRENIKHLTDLPNIGKTGAADLKLLGIENTRRSHGEISVRNVRETMFSNRL